MATSSLRGPSGRGSYGERPTDSQSLRPFRVGGVSELWTGRARGGPRLPRRLGGRGGAGRLQPGDAASSARRCATRRAAGADAVLAVIAERASHAAEPPRPVAAAMAAADVVLAPTVQSLSHTAARKRASEAGARIATLPGVTEEMLARVMSADMDELRRRAGDRRRAQRRLGGADHLPNGSDLRLGLEGREAIPDAGELTAPGAFGNLPCGEGFIAPAGGHEGHARDRRLDRRGRGGVDEPVELVVEDGHLTSARGGQGMAFMELLTEPRRGGHERRRARDRHQREGDPDRQHPRGREDPRHRHVAFGASAAIGGDGPGPGPPRLRRDEPTVTSWTASRSSATASCWSERWPPRRCSRPQLLRGPSERVIDASEPRWLPRPAARRPLRPRAQPQRLHARRRRPTPLPRRWSPAPPTRSS